MLCIFQGYKPEINLAYLDDHGRAMSSKEAFRYLSHKFHGKTRLVQGCRDEEPVRFLAIRIRYFFH